MTDQTDLKDALNALTKTIEKLRDELVRKDVYDSDEQRRRLALANVEDDVKDMKAIQSELQRERRADRRVVLGALLASGVTMFLNLYDRSQGVS